MNVDVYFKFNEYLKCKVFESPNYTLGLSKNFAFRIFVEFKMKYTAVFSAGGPGHLV